MPSSETTDTQIKLDQRASIAGDLIFITKVFLLAKLVQYTLIFFTPETPFDTSTKLLLDKYVLNDQQLSFWNRHIWNKLLSWDAVFFIKGMVTVRPVVTKDSITSWFYIPEFEHEFAFSPLWITLVKWLYRVVTSSSSSSQEIDFYITLKIAVVTTNLLHYLSTIILYYLTLTIYKNDNNASLPSQLARKTAILFIFSSAAGFLSTIYSEPLSFFTTFLGLLARAKTIQANFNWRVWPLYSLGTTLPFTIATLNRSNCVLLGIVYLYDLYYLSKRVSLLPRAILFPLLSGLTLFISFILQQYYIPYTVFCQPSHFATVPVPVPVWCDSLSVWPFTSLRTGFITRVSLYKYIQAKYWNVGLLRYWTVSNVPNFVFAVPNVVILGYASFYYYYNRYSLSTATARPVALLTVVFLGVILLFAHVQIINRISSFIPLHLWFVAECLVREKRGLNSNFDMRLAKCYVLWLVVWFPLQTVLFASFLPPA